MKKHAFLILIHQFDDTLRTLLSMIDDCRNDVYIHIDKKTAICKDDILCLLHKSRCFFANRVRVHWGGYSMVQAEFNLFELAYSNGGYAYYHLLSGSDLPLMSNDDIHNFFSHNEGKEFVQFYRPLFEDSDRVRFFYFFINSHIFNKIFSRDRLLEIESYSVQIQRFIRINRNQDFPFQKGSQWVSVTEKLVSELLSEKELLLRRFRFTLVPDELLMQSFIVSHPKYLERLYVKDFNDSTEANKRFIDWHRGSPYIWKIEDYEELIKSKMVFARKFDSKKDCEIIGKIKNLILTKI